MKRKWKDTVIALIMGAALPYLLLNGAGMVYEYMAATVPPAEPIPTTDPIPGEVFHIRVKQDASVEEMDLEEYLVGVVLGEMPTSFEPEALKAQAVVARTYTLRRWETGTKHDDADICTDPGCCQAYRDPDGCGETPEAVAKVRSAVAETAGLVLTYKGKLIEATYFSSSGGRTEDALAVWGSDLPYLQATDSPEDGYEDKYLREITFTPKEFQDALGRELSGDCGSWFGKVRYTNGGGVDTMVIGGREYEGTMLRKLLGLRSTAFTVSVFGNTITIITRGYGHRVGMSQYGAEAMAVSGSKFPEILAHYYRDTVLEEFIDIGLDFG